MFFVDEDPSSALYQQRSTLHPPSVYFAMAQLKPWNGTKFYLWLYLPSMGASITFTILFMIGTAVIAFRIFRTRTWFSLAFMIGGLCKPGPGATMNPGDHVC